MTDHAHVVKNAVDAFAAFLTVGSIIGVLPTIASALTIIWYCARFYEWWRKR